MTDAFTIKNYSILTSLNKPQIYIKMMDTTNHLTYETSVDCGELRLSISLDDAYKVITNCFAEDEGYKVAITVKAGVMKLKFHALIGSFLKLDFDILLREKLISNDSQLTLFMNQLEQRQETAVETLTKRCNDLASLIEANELRIKRAESIIHLVSNAEIELRMNAFYPINTQILKIQADTYLKIEKIQYLYRLQEVVFSQFSFADFTGIKNLTVKIIVVENASKMVSLKGLDGFPIVEILTVLNAPLLRDFSAIYKSNVKSLRIANAPTEIQEFCKERGIVLSHK